MGTDARSSAVSIAHKEQTEESLIVRKISSHLYFLMVRDLLGQEITVPKVWKTKSVDKSLLLDRCFFIAR